MLQPDVPAWFEIPVTDIDRAQRFYEALLGVAMKRSRYMGHADQAVFPNGGPDHASGALVQALPGAVLQDPRIGWWFVTPRGPLSAPVQALHDWLAHTH